MWYCKNCGTSLDDSVEQCSSCGYPISNIDEDVLNTKIDEKTLKTIASAILYIGIFMIGGLLIGGFYLSSKYDSELAICLFLLIFPVLLTSIGNYALFNVISNISITLKEINRKSKK